MGKTVTLGELEAEQREQSYPATMTDLRQAYGDYTLDLPGGEAELRDLLDRVETEEFADHAAVVAAIENRIGVEGVGRREYTDRGGVAGEENSESF